MCCFLQDAFHWPALVALLHLLLLLQSQVACQLEDHVLACPAAGHVNFNDEVAAALRLADGMLLCVDAVEGVMCVTDKAIRAAMSENIPICLLITKVQYVCRAG